MKAAAMMAQKNEEKTDVAKEYEEVATQIKQLEKRKDYLKDKLMPMMRVGERIGNVMLTETESLAIDDELLAKLEKDLGAIIIRREPNMKILRPILEEKKMLADIPKTKKPVLKIVSGD